MCCWTFFIDLVAKVVAIIVVIVVVVVVVLFIVNGLGKVSSKTRWLHSSAYDNWTKCTCITLPLTWQMSLACLWFKKLIISIFLNIFGLVFPVIDDSRKWQRNTAKATQYRVLKKRNRRIRKQTCQWWMKPIITGSQNVSFPSLPFSS